MSKELIRDYLIKHTNIDWKESLYGAYDSYDEKDIQDYSYHWSLPIWNNEIATGVYFTTIEIVPQLVEDKANEDEQDIVTEYEIQVIDNNGELAIAWGAYPSVEEAKKRAKEMFVDGVLSCLMQK